MAIKQSLQAGVTLIEMIVVVGIIAAVSAVMMFNYSDFSTNVSVRNLSQEIALSIRKAQTYATSVRSVDGTSIIDSSAFAGYGISFSTAQYTDAVTPSEKQFILFVEIPLNGSVADGIYTQQAGGTCGDLSASQECVETFNFTSADKIVAICSNIAASESLASCTTKGSVDISFRRPTPDAHIIFKAENGLTTKVGNVLLVVESAKGVRKGITVWNTGQISVR